MIKTVLFLLFLSPLFGDQIGNVEFFLPKSCTSWEIGNKIESKKGKTVLYFPKEENREEFFGVCNTVCPCNRENPGAIKETLEKMFPTFSIDFVILEKSEHSILYEWNAQENSKKVVHGWGRVFLDDCDTTFLSYQTAHADEIEKAKGMWLDVLKNATLKKS